jgi:hypothetical protein
MERSSSSASCSNRTESQALLDDCAGWVRFACRTWPVRATDRAGDQSEGQAGWMERFLADLPLRVDRLPACAAVESPEEFPRLTLQALDPEERSVWRARRLSLDWAVPWEKARHAESENWAGDCPRRARVWWKRGLGTSGGQLLGAGAFSKAFRYQKVRAARRLS